MKFRKKQTAVKGRFSAVLISAAVHVAVLIAAGTFVAVTVVQRQEARFEGRQVSRPRMQLQRLQVPQRARTERQAPQMSQRVTAQAIDTRSIEFQMPEIAGLGGGIRVDMSGAGFAGSLGFASPQVNLFGLRGAGEKMVFILDTSTDLLDDRVGGIPAYEVIKSELLRMIERLPPTTLFNVIVYESALESRHRAFSADLQPALPAVIEEIKAWLAPLNNSRSRVGLETLAGPGVQLVFEPMPAIPNLQTGWMVGLCYALQNQVDTVYWLGSNDRVEWIHNDLLAEGRRGRPIDPPSGQPEGSVGYDFERYPGGQARWESLVAQAQKMFDEENARRRAAGQPERVLRGIGRQRALVTTYLSGQPIPELLHSRIQYNYTPQDVLAYVQQMQQKYGERSRRTMTAGLRGQRMTLNVVHFVPAQEQGLRLRVIDEVARRLNGGYVQIRGLEAIRSAAGGE